MKNLVVSIIGGLIVTLIVAVISWYFLAQPSVAIRINTGEVDLDNAPFVIPIQGTVSHAKRKYLYLVVYNDNAEWIQPGLGYGYDGEFMTNAYLGIKHDDNSMKTYSVFGVVSNREHKQYEHLDRKSVLVTSKIIRIRRTH